MYDLYIEYLNEMSKYFDVFMHYAYASAWTNSGVGAWGSKNTVEEDINSPNAYKFKALQDWIQANK